MILGVDEVGRGPWAGPLVVGAVILGDFVIDGLTDSKKLSRKKRAEFDVLIREKASGYGLGWVSAEEIDEIGLSAALRLGTIRAVEQVKAPYHEIIIDGTINFLEGTSKGKYVTTLAKADLLIASASAASVIAKVARDAYMSEQDAAYPGYGFSAHVGYGTARHRLAIEKLGVTPLHRLSIAPLAKYRTDIVGAKAPSRLTSKSIGDNAEEIAARYLEELGHEIVERNWKTKYCEIDIISRLANNIYFIEVKYRRSAAQGGGLGAITPTKLKQMRFAAEYYTTTHPSKSNPRLGAISMTGTPPTSLRVQKFLEIE